MEEPCALQKTSLCAFVPLCLNKKNNPLCSLCLCVSSPPLDVNQESAGILKKTAPTNDNGRRIPLHLQRQTKKQDN